MTLVSRKPEARLLGIVAALGGRWHGHHAMCRCPVHEDRTPSLSLRQGDHGILVTCFAGCDSVEVLRALRRMGPTISPAIEPAPAGSSSFGVRRLWESAGSVIGTASAYAQLHRLPAWSSLGARRLDRLALPATLTRLEIAEDADAEGAAAALRSVAAYTRPGLEIVRRPPPRPFEDWAAVLEAAVKRGGGSAR